MIQNAMPASDYYALKFLYHIITSKKLSISNTSSKSRQSEKKKTAHIVIGATLHSSTCKIWTVRFVAVSIFIAGTVFKWGE
ncbi:hypothetical protein [Terribacillus saccharophilus]|uniref:hypothetical protein n=1 Tax=Terribacillus saccharophilus TaxID=361277 RepID=UPI003981A1F5